MNEAPITLITGTRKGIGRYLAEYYLQRGHHVVGVSREAAGWTHANYVHFTADVADEPQVQKVFTFIRKEHGRLDHLINNAGVASMNLALLTPLSTVQKILETNVTGTFLFCREAARIMRKHRFGRIVNLSTVAIPLCLKGESIYAASKSAVITMTQILAREFAEWNITVNCLGPAPIATDLIRGVPDDKIQEILARQAITRFGEMADVANVTDFYLSKASDFITAQHIYLGGL